MSSSRLQSAVRRLAGTDRVVLYDVPLADAPKRERSTTPFVSGGRAWWRFVNRRRALDDGMDLNLIVALRGLSDEERLVAVGWGTAYANSFLLVEPRGNTVDLTSFNEDSGSEPQVALRNAYAEWTYWLQAEDGELRGHRVELPLGLDSTLWSAVWDELPNRFKPADFLSVLTLLNLREAELFTGGREVAQALVPFLTRIGLPILYDARHVMQAMRQLIDAGLASVQDPQDAFRTYRGPSQPLPADITDERLAFMLR